MASKSFRSTNQRGRWEETSTTSISSPRAAWGLRLGTQRARGCLQHW